MANASTFKHAAEKKNTRQMKMMVEAFPTAERTVEVQCDMVLNQQVYVENVEYEGLRTKLGAHFFLRTYLRGFQ